MLCFMSSVTYNWIFIASIVSHSPMSMQKSNILFNTFSSKLDALHLQLTAEQQTFHSLIDSLSSQKCSKYPSAFHSKLSSNSQQKSWFLHRWRVRSPSGGNSGNVLNHTLPPISVDLPLDSGRLPQPTDKHFKPEESSWNLASHWVPGTSISSCPTLSF